MKKTLPITFALIALAGGLVSCTPADNGNAVPTQEIIAPPTELPGVEAEKSSEQAQLEMTDLAVQTDMQSATKALDDLSNEHSGDDFKQKAQELLENGTYNEGTELAFEARDSGAYTLKGWNKAGWKFTSKKDALVYESGNGFTNAWAASPAQ